MQKTTIKKEVKKEESYVIRSANESPRIDSVYTDWWFLDNYIKEQLKSFGVTT